MTKIQNSKQIPFFSPEGRGGRIKVGEGI